MHLRVGFEMSGCVWGMDECLLDRIGDEWNIFICRPFLTKLSRISHHFANLGRNPNPSTSGRFMSAPVPTVISLLLFVGDFRAAFHHANQNK